LKFLIKISKADELTVAGVQIFPFVQGLELWGRHPDHPDPHFLCLLFR